MRAGKVIWRNEEDIAKNDPRREGYVEVPEATPSREGWHWFADPSAICCRPLRSGNICRLDVGHPGRCTSVTHSCDCCDRVRRGPEPWVVNDEVGICFMCYQTNWQDREWKKKRKPAPYPHHGADWHEIRPDLATDRCETCGEALDLPTKRTIWRRDERERTR